MQAGTADGASRGLPGLVTTVAHVQHRRCLFQGPRLTLTFGASIVLIWGGNALVIWQFRMARTQTDRLTDANQKLIEVLRFRRGLLSFHRRLDELARTMDATTERKPSKSFSCIVFSQIAHGPQQNSNRWIGQSFIPVESHGILPGLAFPRAGSWPLRASRLIPWLSQRHTKAQVGTAHIQLNVEV